MITASMATLSYEDHGRTVYACNSIDLEIARGEFLGILGPSGSGKSSLLYLLSGLKLCSSGAICVEGTDIAQLSDEERSKLRISKFGFIFQHPFLLGYLSAVENVCVQAPRIPRSHAMDLLAQLGVSDKAHRRPYELSGGERQRVCVARALINSPDVIFADEPTASLDHTNGVQVVDLLTKLRGNGSLVMVTHDATMLKRADRIVQIVDGRLNDSYLGPAVTSSSCSTIESNFSPS